MPRVEQQSIDPESPLLAVDSQRAHNVQVASRSPKFLGLDKLPSGPPLREELARLVDNDGGRDDAENGFFESANDPQFRTIETAQRRRRAQLRRRLRHLRPRDELGT
jgi:hypothetical protein